MAESQVKEVLGQEITCPLCFDVFQEPKKLPCDHVYCKECLRGLAMRSFNATISCPECRTVIQLPGNDVDNFPTYFRMNRLIEVFQKVQILEESDSPNIYEVCLTHPTQPLAIYCETCKKQLCRDCVLMTHEHSNHEYSFFKDIAPKYREKIHKRLSLIKNQALSVSNALGEIIAAGSTVANHAQKCQDDIDHDFEEIFSELQWCKETMKIEAAAYYSSLTNVLDRQKEELQSVEGNIKDVVASVEATLQDDNQGFLTKMDLMLTNIDDLQKKLPIVPLIVAKPQLIAPHVVSSDSLRTYMKMNCFVYKVADAEMCTVDNLSFMHTRLQLHQQISFTLTLCDSKGNVCQEGENTVEADLVSIQGKIITKSSIKQLSRGRIKITFILETRGRHWLNVRVNGSHIKNSPFTLTINMPLTLLSVPVDTIQSGLKQPHGLILMEGKLLATDIGHDRIVQIDSQHHVREFKSISGAIELTHDSDLNLYVSTGNKHKIHKLSRDGQMIKTIGQLGKRNAEFNFPNGLAISNCQDLYICDSGNSRIQVFDLNLNFKRSFGKKGTGKVQFKYPSDLDFDLSGNIYVADSQNYRIQVFTRSEDWIRTIAHVFLPANVLVHAGHIFVTDTLNHHVLVMNKSEEIIAKFGGGHLYKPQGIAIDKDGFVYVTSDCSVIVVF